MIHTRKARALAAGVIAVLLLVCATAAYAAVIRKFKGKTGQNQVIAFQTAHGFLTHLQFRINDKCPSGRVWRIRDFNFPKIKVRQSLFDAKFSSTTSNAQVEIKGTVGKKAASGMITERRFIAKEHHFCNGSAKFTATRQ